MDLLHNLYLGFSTAMHPASLAYCFFGVLLGTLIGVLPGLGPTTTIAILLPVTFKLDASTALIMLSGIYYGAQYGGSTTAILINLPGEASSAVTAIDGYRMARNGRAGTALATAAIGSFVAGTIATMIIAVLAVPLTSVALRFGPAEYFSLLVLAFVLSITLAHGSVLKALGMILLGLLFGLVGTDVTTGETRFTLGIDEIADKLEFVSVAVALFGISEILRNLEGSERRSILTETVSGLIPSREDLRRMIPAVLRGTGIGSLVGILPGSGATLASFASYSIEKRLSKYQSEFGNGAIEGVAGPESANNAGAQTSFIPMLTLGIPSNPVMALMIGAFIMQGIVPGPNIAKEQPALFWGIIASMWIGNFFLVILNLPLVGLWVKLLKVPYYVLIPTIMTFSAIGVYSVNNNVFDVYQISVFGVIGYALIKFDCEPAPFLLGFILGPLTEEMFRRSMMVSGGDLSTFVTKPISATLLLIALLSLIAVVSPSVRRKREETFVE